MAKGQRLDARLPRRAAIARVLGAIAVLLATLLVIATAWPRPAVALPSIDIEVAFPNLSFVRMVHLTHAGDGTNRLFTVLKPGQIMVFDNSPDVSSADVFLDIRSQVNSQGSEEGLLGLAFDPGYVNNGFFYVYYSASPPRRSVISRFSVSSSNPNAADPQSELILLEVDQPFSNHNGGALVFGPDGNLYISLGDGGSGGDPQGNGQNTATLLGSILRIDVSNATAQETYQVPADNPFVGAGGGVKEEIWAYGLRNPWKFSFDLEQGDLWAADVGQDDFEEIDIIVKGGNYGWNITEGFHCYPPGTASCDQSGLTPPIFEYTHAEGCSITGGHVYRGTRIPVLAGAYTYADFCSGKIWGLRYDGTTVTEQALLLDSTLPIPSFGEDESGELYILSFDGRIYQFVVPASQPPTPTPTPTATPTSTPTPTPSQPASTPTSPPPEPTPTPVTTVVVPDSQITPVPTTAEGITVVIQSDLDNTFTSPAGDVTVFIPKLAVAETGQLEYKPVALADALSAPQGTTLLKAFELNLFDFQGKPRENRLIKSITITVKYTAADLALTASDGTGLRILVYNATNRAWVPLLTRVDLAAKTISASVERLSLFAVSGQAVVASVPPAVGGVAPNLGLLLAVLLGGVVLVAVGAYIMVQRRRQSI